MDSVQFVRIGLRVLGLWFFGLSLQMTALTLAVHPSVNQAAVISYAVALGYLAVGAMAWFFARGLARFIVGTRDSESVWTMDETGALSVAVAFSGLLLIVLSAVRDVGDYLAMVVMLIASGQSAQLASASVNVGGCVALAKLAFGLWLVFKARWIAGRISRSPSAGGVAGQ